MHPFSAVFCGFSMLFLRFVAFHCQFCISLQLDFTKNVRKSYAKSLENTQYPHHFMIQKKAGIFTLPGTKKKPLDAFYFVAISETAF